jgi:dicarboxylate transporter 10
MYRATLAEILLKF